MLTELIVLMLERNGGAQRRGRSSKLALFGCCYKLGQSGLALKIGFLKKMGLQNFLHRG